MKKLTAKLFILGLFVLISYMVDTMANPYWKNPNINSLISSKDTLNLDTLFPKEDHEIGYLSLYEEILKHNIMFPDIVWAQAVLESGHFKSKVFLENNNFFGMRLPNVRKTVAVGKKNGYAIYESWVDCVKDYKLYQDFIFRKRSYTRENYFAHLNKTYSMSGASYSSKLKKIIKTLQKRINQTNNEKTNPSENGDHQKELAILNKEED